MTLEEVIELQAARGLGDVHVAECGEHGFVLAHTDEEREDGENTAACPVHVWLKEHEPDDPPEPGVYAIVAHQPDAYSEPYGAEPYDLLELDKVPS